jgi:transposase-like protein
VLRAKAVGGGEASIIEDLRQRLPMSNSVNQDGQREVLGLDVGPSEDGAFWPTIISRRLHLRTA